MRLSDSEIRFSTLGVVLRLIERSIHGKRLNDIPLDRREALDRLVSLTAEVLAPIVKEEFEELPELPADQ